MRTRIILRFAAAVALVALVVAPLVAVTRGPDAGGYTATDATVYSFVDVAGAGGAALLSGSDDAVAALTLPFPFAFYGQSYSLVCVSSNGALYFITAAASCSGVNDIGNVDLALTTPNDWPALFPFWSDLTFQAPGAGAVFYQTVGAPGNRRFIVQWNNALPIESQKAVTFEIVLSEGTNTVLFQYKTVALGAGNPASAGAEATVGVRNANGPATNQQLEWSFNSAVLHDSSALLFTTTLSPTLTLPDSTVVYDGMPHAAPASLTGVNNEVLGPLTITYNGSATAPTNAGTYDVVASFAGSATYAAVTGNATLTINQATPTITWAAPAPVAAGTALSGAQLNATASVAGSFAYAPPAGTVLGVGPQTLSVTLTPTDATNYTTAMASVPLTVTPPANRPPVAVADTYTVQWNTPGFTVGAPGVLVNDTDADHNPLTALLVAGPSKGTLTLHPDGSFVYSVTNANVFNTDSFTYRANDGTASGNIVTVTLNVGPNCNTKSPGNADCLAKLPGGKGDAYVVQHNTTLTVAPNGVLANDTPLKPGGPAAISAQLFSGPSHGTLTLNANGGFVYTPAPGFIGSDAFRYAPVTAGGVVGTVVTVTIAVR